MKRPKRGTPHAADWLRRLRILPSEPREPLAREIRANLPAVLIIGVIVLGLEIFGWLTWLENDALDAWLRTSAPHEPGPITIVQIDDADYQTIFGGRSPLDPAKLQDVLSKIAAARPAVIAVDLETSNRDFNRPGWPRAVWARDAEPVCEQQADSAEPSPCLETDRFTRLPVLGGLVVESRSRNGVIETEPRSGIVLIPRDRDGIVRRFQRTFNSDSAEPPQPLKGRVDSFPRAIVKAYHEARGERTEEADKDLEGENLILNFTGDRYSFRRMTAQQVLEGAGKEYWTGEKSPLLGRIVVLGGRYRAGRDVYFTPVGLKFGVDIIAQAVESELAGGGIRPVNHATALAADIVAGLLLIVLNWRIRSRFILVIDILFILGASLAGSYLAFRAFGHWFNFTAVLVSVWIHMLVEKSRHGRRKLQEAEEAARQAREQVEALRLKYEMPPHPSGASS